MPIYEYRCTACQHKMETLQKFSDPPLVTCPQCSKDALTKLVSAAGFQLKGSGWYQTDFRGGSKPAEKSAAPEGEAKSSETAKTDKTESAPAKAESAPAAATPAASGPAASA